MAETAAPAPVVQEPTKIPAPELAGSQGSAALASEPKAAEISKKWEPLEYDLEVKGQKQKVRFENEDQLKAILQKAVYADQVIKDAAQAKRGASELMAKLKTREGRREVFSDPEIGVDEKKAALEIVQEMMEDEKLTPEQRELRELKKYREDKEAAEKARQELEQQKEAQEKTNKQAQEIRGQIIDAMKKYPDIPQTQATMDACILNMRAAFNRFGKHLTPEQAMTVYSQQYWAGLKSVIDKLPDEELVKRFDQKTIDRIQKMKLNELKAKTNPANKVNSSTEIVKKKKNLTEKEFDQHFQQLAGGL